MHLINKKIIIKITRWKNLEELKIARERKNGNLLNITGNPQDLLIAIKIAYVDAAGRKERMELDLSHPSNKNEAIDLLYGEKTKFFNVDRIDLHIGNRILLLKHSVKTNWRDLQGMEMAWNGERKHAKIVKFDFKKDLFIGVA